MITVEQAIQNIIDIKNMYTWSIGADEALDMAISALQAQEETVSRKVYEQISWERDIAVMQLKDLGYGLGEKIRTDGDTISRRGAIKAVSNWLYDGDDRRSVDQLLSALPSVEPEFAKDKNVPINNDISRQAVMALDMFTKIFCRDYAVRDDLAFRCNQCEFKMSNGKCLAKVMARKTCPDYKNFGCMGDL